MNGRLNRVTLAEWRSRVRLSSINALFSYGGVARCLAAIRDSPKTLYAFLIVSAVLLVPYAMPFVDRRNVFAWDMLLLSGFATLAVGLVLARSGPRRLERMLDRLVRRGVLITVEPLSDIKTDLEQKTRVWRTAGAVIVAACVLISFLTLITMNWRTPRAGSLLRLGLFETAWAYVVGGYLGSMAANGKVGWYLKRRSASVCVSPGHIDGAAGLKPFGDFCLYQAMVVAIPGVFLAVWTFLIPAWPELTMRGRYIQWMHPYMALLAATSLDERMGPGSVWNRLDFRNAQNSEVCLPLMKPRQRIVIGAEILRQTGTSNRLLEHIAQRQAIHDSPVRSRTR